MQGKPTNSVEQFLEGVLSMPDEINRLRSRLATYEAALRKIAGEANALTWDKRSRDIGNKIGSLARKALETK